MFITCAQNKILKKFTCERLSSNPINKSLIQNVVNTRNPKLVNYLQNQAWNEDLSGKCAFYLIKQENEIALFFSLKTGLLFNQPMEEDELKNTIRVINTAINARKDIDNNSDDKEAAENFLKHYGFEKMTLKQLEDLYSHFEPKKSDLFADKMTEINKLFYHVQETYSGIELHIFCANEKFKPIWKSYGFAPYNTMGSVLFWRFIVNKIFEIKKHVGCEYFYLFAADSSPDDSLISYYNMLSFERDKTLGTNKPYFDWQSKFMCQKIEELNIKRKDFFLNFNPDKDIPIV